MIVERLKKCFELNEPIFIDEILEIMQDYSRQRVYQMIAEADNQGTLIRYDKGIYYLPLQTEFGQSVPSVNSVVCKKYIKNKGNVFGIYGKYVIDLYFLASYQVPNVIEVITNNESRKIREINIRGRKVVLRKSRLPITNENVEAYTLMELFSNIDMRQYKEDKEIKDSVFKYIREKSITRKDVLSLADYFPAKTMKNLATSGVLYELAQQ
ncbi:MAG TPA: hypothetical protein DCY93_00245 [Firmicutes bacterium]|nr:hypothetical protein [Bacillota bacterium]